MEALHELKGLWVSVDLVEYSRGVQTTPERPHAFAYFITIHNDSPVAVIIKGRKWVVTSASGETLIVEGDGVVGQFPRLAPGTQFHYNSFHLVDSNSRAEGSYLGQDETGQRIFVRIPPFQLVIP
jgi:ApaG protein